MLSLFQDKHIIENEILIALGWGSSVFAIVLIVIGLMSGLSLTYIYYNNIQNGEDEITQETSTQETKIHTLIILSSIFSGIGVLLILFFAYINFLL